MRSTRRVIEATACGLLFALLMPAVAGADGEIVAWGHNGYGQCDVPAPNTDFVAVAAGGHHSLGLKGGAPDCPGDLDGDGDVDLADLATLLAAYGTCAGDPGYNPDADLDADGDVDLADLAALLGVYGTTCP